jgi:hypothetical protein
MESGGGWIAAVITAAKCLAAVLTIVAAYSIQPPLQEIFFATTFFVTSF